MRVSVNGHDVTGEIRTPEVSRAAAAVAAVPAVRQGLLGIQRAIGKEARAQRGIVVEGRDIGTVVFPEAPIKFFLEASPEVRVKRRHLELQEQGLTVDLSATRNEIDTRDLKDSNRTISPLKAAADAMRIDSTVLTLEEVVSEMLQAIHKKRSETAGLSDPRQTDGRGQAGP
jgi:cytidylate kinase